METSGYVDIFATKGTEYILILGFFIALAFFWRFLSRSRVTAQPEASGMQTSSELQFKLQPRLFYHQGHSWAMPERQNVVRVGIDDFAQRLIGPASFVELPEAGGFLEQGGMGCRLRMGSQTIDILSPVTGEVLAVNADALENPRIVNQDPYGKGWLMKVRVPNMNNNIRNLLSGELAEVWMNNAVDTLRQKMAGNLHLPIGGDGRSASRITHNVSQDQWIEITREFFLNK